MAEDVCTAPQITRLSLGRRSPENPRGGTGYQVNDERGGYVVLTDEEALRAAHAIIADLHLRSVIDGR